MRYSQLRTISLLLFFLGGVSALVYEVTWVRLLSLSFGVSVYAVSAVLTAFMGGLALGSWLFGRLAARIDGRGAPYGTLLRLYGLIQLGVGVCALLSSPLFALSSELYVWIYRQFAPDFYTFNLIRFGLAIMVLLAPTSLIGGTLPVMGQLLARHEASRGGDLGGLYAASTFGGVLGAFATGLVMIRLFGVQNTIYLAVAIDWIVAAVAFALAQTNDPFDYAPLRQAQEPGRQRPTTNDEGRTTTKNRARARAGSTENRVTGRRQGDKETRRQGEREARVAQPESQASSLKSQVSSLKSQASSPTERLVLWGFALSGFASLGYEVIWTRLLAIFSLNAVFSFTIMLTTFLVGLAVGGAIAARRADRVAQPLALFGTLELAIGVSAVLVLFVFAKLPSLLERFTQPDTFGRLVFAEFFAATITMFVPAALIGATFPAAARIYGSGEEAVGRRVGRMYALNTVRAALGAFVAGFGLIPLLGLQRSALTLAILNLAIGAAALLSLAVVPRRRLAGAIAVAVVGALLLPPGVYLGFREGTPPQLVFYREGADATVAVFEVKDPPLKVSFVNGLNEVPTDRYSMRAFYLLGHLAPLLRPSAESALMVSFGNGIASGAMSRHAIPRIQAVELVAEQVAAARIYQQENRGVLDYPGLHITIEDGRNYMLRSDEHFDIITADATHPINTSSWALFTRDFYSLTRQRLAEDGIFVQWLPFHDLSSHDFRDIVKTFQSVFPHTSLWYTGGTHSFLVATPQPLTRAEIAGLDPRIKAEGIADDLGDARQLAGDMLMDEGAVAQYVNGARIVTDDNAFFIPARDMDAILQSFAPYAQVGQAQP
jgi:spermidine synthase